MSKKEDEKKPELELPEIEGDVELGDVAKDRITGYKGIVVGVTKWLHGCERISIQPQELKDGKPIDSVSFDRPQVALLKKNAAASTDGTGGPRPEPKQKTVNR